MSVVWHDLECGAYDADLGLWCELAGRHGGPVLDVGAGTGRTAIMLARAGVSVTALDNDPELLEELGRRSQGLDVEPVLADARDFALGRRFPLIVVPMQTIQLLGGAPGRARFLACARDHLDDGALLAAALTEELELFEVPEGAPSPLPDVCERDGVVYSSRPTAVRAAGDAVLLERRREVVSTGGALTAEMNLIRLDRLSAAELEREAAAAGLGAMGRVVIAPTRDHVGSVVVMLGG
ncbi:MAG TPA: class I SAM-dependent methyltransferase [Solirubrobacteraceae bacterium]